MGNTPLHIAADVGNGGVSEELVRRAAYVNSANEVKRDTHYFRVDAPYSPLPPTALCAHILRS